MPFLIVSGALAAIALFAFVQNGMGAAQVEEVTGGGIPGVVDPSDPKSVAARIMVRARAAGWSDAMAQALVTTAIAESAMVPDVAVQEANGSASYGLFQFNSNGQGKGMDPNYLRTTDGAISAMLQVMAHDPQLHLLDTSATVAELTAYLTQVIEKPANTSAAAAQRAQLAKNLWGGV